MVGGFCGDPQGGRAHPAAVGADAANGPGIVGLIGIAAIFGDAAAVIELPQVGDCFLHGGPHFAKKSGGLTSCQNIVAIDHQDEFRIQVFPVVSVLPAGFIDRDERVAFGYTKVVGYGTFFLALVQNGLASLLRFPNPESLFRILARNSIRKLAEFLFFDFRPEFEQRHGCIESNIQGGVVCVVKTFEERERGWSFLIASRGTAPECASLGASVQCIEEHAPVPERLGFIADKFVLPSGEGSASGRGRRKSIAGDRPSIISRSAVEIPVPPIPFASPPKLDHGKIPRDNPWDDFLL